ncbi:hypothetical protein FF38_13819 [Lucilia cuprina]|uniref:Uncharacterized protein n=1 Tax=Lucilia cuprina TaxID=7375 RepID=A0A0L0BUQ7_LUCCU|nr:hypothetical protein FF38_13819 [Lucilia cuprina]
MLFKIILRDFILFGSFLSLNAQNFFATSLTESETLKKIAYLEGLALVAGISAVLQSCHLIHNFLSFSQSQTHKKGKPVLAKGFLLMAEIAQDFFQRFSDFKTQQKRKRSHIINLEKKLKRAFVEKILEKYLIFEHYYVVNDDDLFLFVIYQFHCNLLCLQ